MSELFPIDSLSLMGGGLVLLLAVATPLLSPFFRIRKQVVPTDTSTPLPAETETPAAEAEASEAEGMPITLLVPVAERQTDALRQHLPQWLGQDYAPGFKVVIVAEKGDSDTEDVINQYASHERLYATYVPQSSRYMSRKKLAITLGVKAAQTEWVVLTDANCAPASSHWLSTYAAQCTDDKNLVVGYANYSHEARSYYRFHRLQTGCYLLREALLHTAYRAPGPVVAFRKSEFIANDGFRGSLQFIRGEYDYLVNKFARPGATGVVTAVGATTIEDAPTRKEWLTSQVYYMHTRQHLARTLRHRWLPAIDQCALHLTFWAAIATLVVGVLTECWLLCAAAALSLVVTAILRALIARRILSAFAEPMASWRIYPYELSGLWHTIWHRLRHSRANQLDFTTHKV